MHTRTRMLNQSAWLLRLATCVIATLAPVAAARALEADVGPLPRLTVPYSDLNLATEAGAQVLLRRMERAARRVCWGDEALPLTAMAEFRRCYAAALHAGVVSVAATKVETLYERKHGQSYLALQRRGNRE